MERYYAAANATQPVAGKYQFDVIGHIGGCMRGVYRTSDPVVIAELDALAAKTNSVVSVLSADEYAKKKRKQPVEYSRLPHSQHGLGASQGPTRQAIAAPAASDEIVPVRPANVAKVLEMAKAPEPEPEPENVTNEPDGTQSDVEPVRATGARPTAPRRRKARNGDAAGQDNPVSGD